MNETKVKRALTETEYIAPAAALIALLTWIPTSLEKKLSGEPYKKDAASLLKQYGR